VTAHALQIVAVGLLVTGSSVFLYKALHGPAEPPVPAKPATRQVAKVPAVAAPLRDQAQSAKPADALAPDLIAALMKRGDQLLELGDTAAARLLFQRAAEAGDAAAATALGKTFDPGFTAPGNARDPGRAAEWYRKAIALGDPRAADLLKRLGVR
jgi:TPR repeat protein